jgi:hypothetical protein
MLIQFITIVPFMTMISCPLTNLIHPCLQYELELNQELCLLPPTCVYGARVTHQPWSSSRSSTCPSPLPEFCVLQCNNDL